MRKKSIQPNQKLHDDKILDKKINHVKKRHRNFKHTKTNLLKKKTAMKT